MEWAFYWKMRDNFYKEYLKSDRWAAKRNLWFSTFGRWCRACGTTFGHIQLHHLTYERLGNEALSDLVALCESCHREVEKLYRLAGRGDRRVATAAFIKGRRKKNGI